MNRCDAGPLHRLALPTGDTNVTSDAPPESTLTAVTISERQRKRALFFLAAAVGCVGCTMMMQLGVTENFLVEDLKVSGFQKGVLESVRETCGITALLVLALFAGFAEPLVAAGMLVLLATGIAGYAFVPDYFWLLGMSLVWSQGLHVWMPLPDAMTLSLAEPDRVGYRLGQVRAAGAVGSGVGLLAAYVMTRFGVPMRPLFVLAAAVGILGAVSCLGIPRRIKTPGPRIVLRRRYGLYYILSLLEGWRKQIFMAFAGYLLVKEHGAQLDTMLMLWAATLVIGWSAAPQVGRLIDRVGERKVLVFYFVCLALFFLGYATIKQKYVLYTIFVIDHAFFVFTMAITTYVGRLAPPSEHTPTLSMGVAMNHVAAVAMPLIGGFIWKLFGYPWIFFSGAAVALISVGPALCVPKRPK